MPTQVHSIHNILTTGGRFVSRHFRAVNLNTQQNRITPWRRQLERDAYKRFFDFVV